MYTSVFTNLLHFQLLKSVADVACYCWVPFCMKLNVIEDTKLYYCTRNAGLKHKNQAKALILHLVIPTLKYLIFINMCVQLIDEEW